VQLLFNGCWHVEDSGICSHVDDDSLSMSGAGCDEGSHTMYVQPPHLAASGLPCIKGGAATCISLIAVDVGSVEVHSWPVCSMHESLTFSEWLPVSACPLPQMVTHKTFQNLIFLGRHSFQLVLQAGVGLV